MAGLVPSYPDFYFAALDGRLKAALTASPTFNVWRHFAG